MATRSVELAIDERSEKVLRAKLPTIGLATPKDRRPGSGVDLDVSDWQAVLNRLAQDRGVMRQGNLRTRICV
jgi:hypothetical protein